MFYPTPYENRTTPNSKRDQWNHLVNLFFDEDFPTPFTALANDAGSFHTDLRENDDAYIVEADLPGVKKEDVNIRFENSQLTISAKRDVTNEVKEENFVRRERHYGQLQRSFHIENVDSDKIQAKFSDGVLSVNLPKGAHYKQHRIQIQ